MEVKHVVVRSGRVRDVRSADRPRTSDVRVKSDSKDQEVPHTRFRVGLHRTTDGWSRHVRARDGRNVKGSSHLASRRSGLTRDKAARNGCLECHVGVDSHRGDAHGVLRRVHKGQVGVTHFARRERRQAIGVSDVPLSHADQRRSRGRSAQRARWDHQRRYARQQDRRRATKSVQKSWSSSVLSSHNIDSTTHRRKSTRHRRFTWRCLRKSPTPCARWECDSAELTLPHASAHGDHTTLTRMPPCDSGEINRATHSFEKGG